MGLEKTPRRGLFLLSVTEQHAALDTSASVLPAICLALGTLPLLFAAIELAGGRIRVCGLVLLMLFLVLIFVEERDSVTAAFGEAVAVIVTFTVLAFLTGWATGGRLHLTGPVVPWSRSSSLRAT